MKEKLISVIVPAYNVENYIRRCLDSLVSQTYQNLEIIVVNDGSTDRTGEIIEEYTERYPDKVMLYTRENQGQAEARNFGISKASGEYIGFVDSDDFVSTKMYELMYREAEEQNCDMVTCGYYGCDEVTGEITVYQTGYKGEFNQNIYENPMLLRINSPYPWNKLYTRELLERSNFSFRKGIIFEDLCAIFPLFMDAKKVGRVHEKLYYYIKGRKGGTISTFNEKHGQIIDALQIMNDAYQQRGMFERFYDTLLFFNLRHIYARFDEMQNYDDIIFKREFKKRAFVLLDQYFPGWRDTEEYAALEIGEGKEGKKAEKTVERKAEKHADKKLSNKENRKTEATSVTPPQEETKSIKKKRRSEQYEELVAEREIDKTTVLVECYHGNDLRGMGYYIAMDLAEHPEYKVYVAAADLEKVCAFSQTFPSLIRYVDMNSEHYLELLATAKYLINNRSFPGFFRKRKDQRLIFTDFLPSLAAQGTEVVCGARNIQGIQLSLAQADEILFPEELREQFIPLLEKYNMAEICRDKGCFFMTRALLHSVHGEDDGTVRVAYMPSAREFPGLKDSKNYLFLSSLRKKLTELDEKLEEGRKILFCFPRIIRRRFKENIWKHIEFFPEDQEPLQVLARCHALVGEYGEEMFVMKALGRPVCQFADDQTDMAWRYGLDSQRGEHGFPVFDSSEKVAEWINGLDSEAVSIGDIGLGWRQTLEDFKKGKNRRLGRTVVYMPAFTSRREFLQYMQGQDTRRSVFFIQKDAFSDALAAWIREYGDIRYMVIIQSIVVSKNESRLIKYHITTKDKLREKRDRQRYLG